MREPVTTRSWKCFSIFRDLASEGVCRILITSVHGLVSIIPLSSGYRENSAAEWSTVEPQETANALSTMDLSPANLFLLQWIPSSVDFDYFACKCHDASMHRHFLLSLTFLSLSNSLLYFQPAPLLYFLGKDQCRKIGSKCWLSITIYLDYRCSCIIEIFERKSSVCIELVYVTRCFSK